MQQVLKILATLNNFLPVTVDKGNGCYKTVRKAQNWGSVAPENSAYVVSVLFGVCDCQECWLERSTAKKIVVLTIPSNSNLIWHTDSMLRIFTLRKRR